MFAQRDTIAMNSNWQFVIDKNSDGFKSEWYKQPLTKARTVAIPHTWNIEDSNQTHYGWAWYQKELQIPTNYKSKQVVIEFGAINHTAHIYLNGIKVAEHIGDGFNKFKVDISKLEIEITETELMVNPTEAKEVLNQFAKQGLKVALDDFGSGYS
ncbi:MAG: hypothetical protein B7Z27_07860, partial [Sphingobacteriia bacterium 32-37-4]